MFAPARRWAFGSIVIRNAQIGRQQRATDNDDKKNYRHAFNLGGSPPRHVLCAESDAERDAWVDILARYVSSTFNEDVPATRSSGPRPISVSVAQGYGSIPPPVLVVFVAWVDPAKMVCTDNTIC